MIERTLPEVVLCKSTYFVQLNDKKVGVRNFTIPITLVLGMLGLVMLAWLV